MKIHVIAFSSKGCTTASKVADVLSGEKVSVFAKTSADVTGVTKVETSLRSWTRDAFATCDAIVFVGATGIAVREVAPFIKTKDVDPAVICLDELAKFCIPLLSGHIGGANALALRIARGIGAVPVVTTATDINKKISIDSFAATHDLSIYRSKPAKDVSASVLEGVPVGLISEFHIEGEIPSEFSYGKDAPVGVYIGERHLRPFPVTLHLIPQRYTLGVGCIRGIPADIIQKRVDIALSAAGITMKNVRAVASVDLKKDEPGLLEFASDNKLPITFYSSAELNAVPGEFTCSEFVRSVTDVDCVCERAAVKVSRDGRIRLHKFAGEGVTVAVAEEDFAVDFTGKGSV